MCIYLSRCNSLENLFYGNGKGVCGSENVSGPTAINEVLYSQSRRRAAESCLLSTTRDSNHQLTAAALTGTEPTHKAIPAKGQLWI